MTIEEADVNRTGRSDALFNVFLSHNGKDKPVVRELAKALAARGLRVWLDEDELQPGLPWQERLEHGILNSDSVAVLVGNDGVGPWENEETQAALILARNAGLPVIPVILPGANLVTNDLSLFLRNRTWVDLRSGLSEAGLGILQWGITGRKTSAGEQATDGDSLNIERDPQSRKFARPNDVSPLSLTPKTGRYLRRRARVITRGTKQFQLLMHALMSRQHKRTNRQEAVQRFEDSWEALKSPYEQAIAHAVYLESFGHIELMRTVLQKQRFTGTAESTRMLYEAIACEKLDDIAMAQRLLRTILDTEKQRSLVRAAQFNTHVCYEKAADFENVDFEAFFQDRDISFVDHERLSDKAVAMHMIVCLEQGRPFIHKRLLAESLEYLRECSAVGYAKTLLTKIESEGSLLGQAASDSILQDLKHMDENSRAAVLVRMYDYLPPEAEALRQSILASVRQEPDMSETLLKWKRAHKCRTESDGKAS